MASAAPLSTLPAAAPNLATSPELPAVLRRPSEAGRKPATDAAGEPALPAMDAETSGALAELVDALRTTPFGLRFEFEEDTHRIITKVIDKESGEVIRQLPSEEVLRIARAIDKLQGLFISQSA